MQKLSPEVISTLEVNIDASAEIATEIPIPFMEKIYGQILI